MTNEELKKKIATIIEAAFDNRCRKTHCRNCDLSPDEMCQPNMYADALIAAGIGDVKEAERRVAKAERALVMSCANMVKDEKSDVNIEWVIRVLYYKYLKQAEKELAEEMKDERT